METDTYLLFDEKRRMMIAVTSNIFYQTQIFGFDSIEKLSKRNEGVLIISRDGQIRKIRKVIGMGLFGESFWEKFCSLAFGNRKIEIQFEDQTPSVSLSEFKSMVIEFLKYDFEDRGDEGFFHQSNRSEGVLNNIKGANSFLDVFNALKFPKEEDCLDSL